MLALLMGNGGLWGPQCMYFQWVRRQDTSGAGEMHSQWGRVAKEKASFEFHKGFERHGRAPPACIPDPIVSRVVRWRRKEVWGWKGMASGFCAQEPEPTWRP